jgi:hypothetical protein
MTPPTVRPGVEGLGRAALSVTCLYAVAGLIALAAIRLWRKP